MTAEQRLLRRVVMEIGHDMDNDNPIDGSFAVDYLCALVRQARKLPTEQSEVLQLVEERTRISKEIGERMSRAREIGQRLAAINHLDTVPELTAAAVGMLRALDANFSTNWPGLAEPTDVLRNALTKAGVKL